MEEPEYKVYKTDQIDPLARKIAVEWSEEYIPGFAMPEKVKLANDIMNFAEYYHKNKLLKNNG